MRVDEELRLDRYKLDRYVTAATVLYLSPHYKQLAGSHVTAKLHPQTRDGGRAAAAAQTARRAGGDGAAAVATMFDELSARFQEVGV